MSTDTTTTVPQSSEIAQYVRDQILASVKQSRKLTLDAVESYSKAAAKVTESFPTPELPKIAGAPVLPDLKTLTVNSYDFAIALLDSEREFAIKLAAALAPATSA